MSGSGAPDYNFCKKCGDPLVGAVRPVPIPTGLASPEAYTPKYVAEKILISKSALEILGLGPANQTAGADG